MDKRELQKRWLRNCVPTVFALLMSGMYSVMDGLFIGRAVGDVGLAAVNIAWPIPAIITAAGTGIGVGGSILYSNYRGQGRCEAAEEQQHLTITMLIGTGVMFTLIFGLGYHVILKTLGARGQIYEQAVYYIRIIIGGSVFQVLSAGLIPLLRNKGEAMRAMVSMVAGMLTNVCLNYILIFIFDMGIRGAALGTVTSQVVVTVCAAITDHKKKDIYYIPMNKRKIGQKICMAGEVIRTGLPAFGLSLAPSVVLIFTNYQCLQYGGDEAVACYAVISYITFPVQYLLAGIGDGTQPLMSYYYGSEKQEELLNIKNMAEKTSVLAGAACTAVVWAAAEYIPELFGLSELAESFFTKGMRISCLSFLLMGPARFHIAYLGAILKTKEASLLIYAETLMAAPFLLFVLPVFLGLNGVWCSLPLGQFLMFTAFYLFFTERKAKI